MMESAADFGTGLRAHLGLEQDQLELVAAPEAAPEQLAVDEIEDVETDEIATAAPDRAALEALEALEASLAGRAGALLAAAQALYDEVLGGGRSPSEDELARIRRRRSLA